MIGTMLFYRLEFINVCESAYVADKWYENINIVKIIIWTGSEYFAMDIKELIGEATEYDKKLAFEEKNPKSWCKSVSAFANTFGGALILVISNDGRVVGLNFL